MKHRSVLFAALGLGFLLSVSAPAMAQRAWHGGGGGWHGGGAGWHGGGGWRGGGGYRTSWGFRPGFGWGWWAPRIVVGAYPYPYPYAYPYYPYYP